MIARLIRPPRSENDGYGLSLLLKSAEHVLHQLDTHVSDKRPISLLFFVQPDPHRRYKPSWDTVRHQGCNLESERK